MKKLILSSLLILSFSIAYSQDCKRIQKSSNEFTGITTYNSPPESNISFYKTFSKDTVVTNALLNCHCPIAAYNLRGAYIKLDDGTVIKNELAIPKIDYDTILGNYDYYCEITLSANELQSLRDHKIVKFAISDLMQDVSKKHSEYCQQYIKCLAQITHP